MNFLFLFNKNEQESCFRREFCFEIISCLDEANSHSKLTGRYLVHVTSYVCYCYFWKFLNDKVSPSMHQQCAALLNWRKEFLFDFLLGKFTHPTITWSHNFLKLNMVDQNLFFVD